MTPAPEPPASVPPSQAQSGQRDEEARRRRRGRNIAMLIVLFALSFLFYAITVVKMTKPGIGG
jgi:hypothetical protein